MHHCDCSDTIQSDNTTHNAQPKEITYLRIPMPFQLKLSSFLFEQLKSISYDFGSSHVKWFVVLSAHYYLSDWLLIATPGETCYGRKSESKGLPSVVERLQREIVYAATGKEKTGKKLPAAAPYPISRNILIIIDINIPFLFPLFPYWTSLREYKAKTHH